MCIQRSNFRLRVSSVNGDVQINIPIRLYVNVLNYLNNPLLPS